MKKYYPQINETLYQEKLANGLEVVLLPKNDYHKNYALFTTEFGSIDTTFVPSGEDHLVQFPAGIAHFLEHKLFEKKDGDVTQKFTELGANTNAFTSFTRTSYQFSTTEHFSECLELLLNFVQESYFTDELVNKEKGIIEQEIQMYQDDPDWRLFFGLLQCLYPTTALAEDIAGTPASIDAITAEMLTKNYQTFYHPHNMNLVIVGNFDPEATLEQITKNQAQKVFSAPEKIRRVAVPKVKTIPTKNLYLNAIRSKMAYGIKSEFDLSALSGVDKFKYNTSLTLLVQMLFGSQSENYLRMFKAGIIDDSFGAGFSLDRGMDHLEVSADVDHDAQKQDLLVKNVQDILHNYQDQADFNEDNFTMLKKRSLGKNIQMLNSLERLAGQFSTRFYQGVLPFEAMQIMNDLTYAELQKNVAKFMEETQESLLFILPKAEE